jgi:hypothetical protein
MEVDGGELTASCWPAGSHGQEIWGITAYLDAEDDYNGVVVTTFGSGYRGLRVMLQLAFRSWVPGEEADYLLTSE